MRQIVQKPISRRYVNKKLTDNGSRFQCNCFLKVFNKIQNGALKTKRVLETSQKA